MVSNEGVCLPDSHSYTPIIFFSRASVESSTGALLPIFIQFSIANLQLQSHTDTHTRMHTLMYSVQSTPHNVHTDTHELIFELLPVLQICPGLPSSAN